MYERIVVITRETRLQELIKRFNTRAQAKFYIEHSGGNFDEYDKEDAAYQRAIKQIHQQLELGLKVQRVDRAFLPNFLFTERDIVVAVGQDGIVANTAKYVGSQPLIGINPDPERYDGILVRSRIEQARQCVDAVLQGRSSMTDVTLAEVELNDGQRLLAFNDFFVGVQSHVSARYRLEFDGRSENQSSSGIIISTGAGSTGWLSSIFNMASSVSQLQGKELVPAMRMEWSARQLLFVVREPFVSRHSTAAVTSGMITADNELIVESHIPTGGTIFSDGVESDFVSFNAGMIARITTAAQQARLVVPPSGGLHS